MMTTIKITDDPDEHSEVQVRTRMDFAEGEYLDKQWTPAAPILLSAHDGPGYEAAGVWLSPAKAREVIVALQAAVDEVEPREPPCTCHLGSKTCERHAHLHRPSAVQPPMERDPGDKNRASRACESCRVMCSGHIGEFVWCGSESCEADIESGKYAASAVLPPRER